MAASQLDCLPHPNTVTQRDGGDYSIYTQVLAGRRSRHSCVCV